MASAPDGKQPQRFETVQLPETVGAEIDADTDSDEEAMAITVGPPLADGDDERLGFADSSDEVAIRYEAPFSDIVITPGAYGQANDVRLRDLELMVDCIFCRQIFPTPLASCPLCLGLGDVPKSTYFRMLEAYRSAIAVEQETLAQYPTVVAGASAPLPVITPIGALADLRNALSISYLHSNYQVQFACCDLDPNWRVYVRWRVGKRRFYVYLQPRDWRGTNQQLAKIFSDAGLVNIEYVLRRYILGGLDTEAAIWRPLL